MTSTEQKHALFQPIKQASYYSQRGSTPGTLLISEATFISHDAGGLCHVPGIYADAQIKGWKMVTDAGHARVLESEGPPSPYVSALPVALTGHVETPRPLTEAEINKYIATYAKAATIAVYEAGFDGVEIHSAHGYLLDQFLQTVSNKRTDEWGRDEQGRTRFTREIVDAVADAVGEDRVSIRICPWSSFLDTKMPEPRPTFAYLVTAIRDKHPNVAYLHVAEPRVLASADVTPKPDENNDFLREIWNGGESGKERIFISAGGYTRETALHTAENKGGLVAFGRLYISNHDLPLTLPDRSTFHKPGNLTPFGYNDWPFTAHRACLKG